MDTIYINENDCRVHRAGEHLLVKRDGRKVMTAPLEGVKSIVVCGRVQFTTQALELFLDRGIDVVFMDSWS